MTEFTFVAKLSL